MKNVIRRLRTIGPHPLLLAEYVAHRYGTRIAQARLRRSYGPLVATVPPGATLNLPRIDLPEAGGLPDALTGDAERIREEAEAVLRHEFDLLGSGPVAVGDVIDWHRDFKSGYRWPDAFYQNVEITRLTDSSDAKVPWELSRGHHLLTLARAAVLWNDDRFAAELERQLVDWIQTNPAGRGINWTNPMEVAIRAVNWVWAIATLETWRPLQSDVRDRVTESLQMQARHIAANLEGTPWLRSNHYLADVLGLVVLGTVIDGDPAAERWFSAGRSAFEREITTQVHADGLAFEASLPYHGLVLEMFLLARFICDWGGRPLPGDYDVRLERMLVATLAARHPNGRLPQFGDSDSGRILPAGSARSASADNLLWLGAALLGGDAPLAGMPHEEVAWTLGLDAWDAAATRPLRERTTRSAFSEGGVYVLRGGGFHVVVRCGDVGQNGNGGHSHNDLLSFELSHGGTPFVVDPGTYAYTSDVAARNAFRSTLAHNTVVVAGREINPVDPDRVFELAQFANPELIALEESARALRLVASHDGYRRLTPPVVHRRTFLLDAADSELRVNDELLGVGPAKATSQLHLAAGTTVARNEDGSITMCLGEVRLRILLHGAAAVEIREGWVSDQFGVRVAAPVLILLLEGLLPHYSGYTFLPTGNA